MADQPILDIGDLNVYYGHAHVLQGVSLTLDQGVLAVVGRNGMGKTTLCNAIMCWCLQRKVWCGSQGRMSWDCLPISLLARVSVMSRKDGACGHPLLWTNIYAWPCAARKARGR